MTPSVSALNVLLASLLLSSAASAAGYQLKVSIPNLPPAVHPSCTTPWGGSVAHNGSVFAYSAESVPFGESCNTVKQERTCNKGTLAGTYAHQTCAPLSACPGGGTQVYATAGTFSFTLPEGCSSATLTAKVWGAGGAQEFTNGQGKPGNTGGNGGYAEYTGGVTSGVVVSVAVGGSAVNLQGAGAGGGGGASAVRLDGVDVAVGGAGAGAYSIWSWQNQFTQSVSVTPGGHGGVDGPTYGTAAGQCIFDGTVNHARCSQLAGPSSYGVGGRGVGYFSVSGTSGYYGGGGGGGYRGGAAKYGGSSYSASGTTTPGSASGPGNATDPHYASPAATQNSPGRVVLTWQ